MPRSHGTAVDSLIQQKEIANIDYIKKFFVYKIKITKEKPDIFQKKKNNMAFGNVLLVISPSLQN